MLVLDEWVTKGKFQYKLLGEDKNKRGEVKTRYVSIKYKVERKGMSLDNINNIYKSMHDKYGTENIQITGQNMDGVHKTLKSFNHFGDDIKYLDDEYFDGLPEKIRKGLQGRYYSVDFTYHL
jgi:hypothetical protein